MNDSLPVIDLSAPDPRELREVCERHGFFYLRGHGVVPALEQRLEQATTCFFALPPEAICAAMAARPRHRMAPLG